MTYLIASSYIPIFVLLVIGLCIFDGKKKKITQNLLLFWVLTPICVIFFLGIFKTKIQKGQFLPDIGPILLLAFPPEDIWSPLFSTELDPTKKEYNFKFQHKYVGKHIVDLSFDRTQILEKIKNPLSASLEIRDQNNKLLLARESHKPGTYWGNEKTGLSLIEYYVPQEVSNRSLLTGTIKIKGNITEFQNNYGKLTIILRKGSDL